MHNARMDTNNICIIFRPAPTQTFTFLTANNNPRTCNMDIGVIYAFGIGRSGQHCTNDVRKLCNMLHGTSGLRCEEQVVIEALPCP